MIHQSLIRDIDTCRSVTRLFKGSGSGGGGGGGVWGGEGRIVEMHFLKIFYLGFTDGQDYFTHFDPTKSSRVGGSKTGDRRETPPYHPQAELGLSHMCPELGSNPQR